MSKWVGGVIFLVVFGLFVAPAAGQVQTVLGLLTQIAESRSLSDENRRLLDTAMLRLRFAIGRMEAE